MAGDHRFIVADVSGSMPKVLLEFPVTYYEDGTSNRATARREMLDMFDAMLRIKDTHYQGKDLRAYEAKEVKG